MIKKQSKTILPLLALLIFIIFYQFSEVFASKLNLRNVNPTIQIDSLALAIKDYEEANQFSDDLDSAKQNKEKTIAELVKSISKITNYKTDLSFLVKEFNNKNIEEQYTSLVEILNRNLELTKQKNNNEIDKLKKQRDKFIQKKYDALVYIQKSLSNKTGSFKLSYKGKTIYIFLADLNKHEIRLHVKKDSTKYYSNTINSVVKELKEKKIKPLAVTNAGMFESNFKPLGLFIENNKELVALNCKDPNDDNFYLMPNGVFFIDTANQAFIKETFLFKREYSKKMKEIKYATQSGPMLVKENKFHPVFTKYSTNNKVRNGIGIINKSKIIIAYSDDVNFYSFAEVFKDFFQCKDALFLDGAISKLYLHDLRPQDLGGELGPILSISEKKSKKT
jgi:uncharacterized protein YigE (DUF2233 family)